jgi:hypothetical protein
MLILDRAPLGNLAQYLQKKTASDYANVGSVQGMTGTGYANVGSGSVQTIQMEMNLIHQVISGVLAVQNLQVR